MVSFKEYMAEEHIVNRWNMLKVGLFGGFFGAILAVIYAILGII